jgi:long-chain acyl-CoA synthetase
MTSTIGQLFFDQSQRLGAKTALRYKQLNPLYNSMSWQDLSTFVEEIAFGLASIPVDVKKAVAIFSPTSYIWVAADLATISIGAVSVPIYPNSSGTDIEYILNNSEAEAIFVAGEKLLAKLVGIKDKIPHIKKIIFLPSLTKKEPDWEELKTKYEQLGDSLVHLNELCLLGQELADSKPQLVRDLIAAGSAEDIATVIYTSGTTGTPKGVPLTHINIMAVLSDLPSVIPINEEDVYFSYLPISHVFERVCGEYYWIYAGCTCAFAESIETMPKNLHETEPTLMVAVPRVLDGIYNKVKNGISSASGLTKGLINWAIAVGEVVVDFKAHDKAIPELLKMQYQLADWLVLRKIRERIGKRLRFIVVGGAPGTLSVLSLFNAIGIPTLEGYGLTETAAPTNVNRFDRVKLGTVGPALPCVEIKIGEDGEILLRGPSIFNGYFKDPQATSEVFVDGWFRTGDVGYIDDDGYLKITDRKKDLIVNAAGKNIAPQRVECLLKIIPPISQAIVFGDRNKHLIALLTVDQPKAMEIAKEQGWQFEKFVDLIKSRQLHQYLKKEINKYEDQLAEYERIKHFAILDHDLSVDSGELTATMKIKRNVIAEKYAETLENLYASK